MITNSQPSWSRNSFASGPLYAASAQTLLRRGIAAFGQAEHLLRRVPARFLRYLDELLLTNERVLFFANTEAFNVRGWTGELDASLGEQAQQ